MGEVALKIRVKSCRTMRLRLTGNAPSCYVPIVVPALLVLAASHSLCHAWEPLPFLPRPQAATAILPVALTALMVVASQPRSVSLRGTSYNNLTRPSDIFPIPGGSLFCLCHAMQCPSPSLPLSDPLFPPPPLLSLSLHRCESKTHRSSSHAPAVRPSVRTFARSVGCCRHFLLACTSAPPRSARASSVGGSRRGILTAHQARERREGGRREAHGEKSIQFPHARKLTSALPSSLSPRSHFSYLVPFASRSSVLVLLASSQRLAAMPIPGNAKQRCGRGRAMRLSFWQMARCLFYTVYLPHVNA